MNAVHDSTSRCPSRLRFDRLLAGELDTAQAHEVETHAEGCARCRPVLAALRKGQEAFAKALPAAVIQRVHERQQRGWRRAWALWSAPALAAAALLIAVHGWSKPSEQASDGVRSKGGPRLAFYVLHDGVVRPGADGERVQPGDRIEFAYTSERDAYLAIVSIDAARKASVYYAKDGRAARIAAASRAVLDQSTLLDGTLGPETVYTFVCSRPIAVAPLIEALERAPEQIPVAPDCAIDRHTLIKVP